MSDSFSSNPSADVVGDRRGLDAVITDGVELSHGMGLRGPRCLEERILDATRLPQAYKSRPVIMGM
jgi:hypothetical protein